MTGGVVWWEIQSHDPAGTQRFYGEMFGWAFRRAFDEPGSELSQEYWIVEHDGEAIGGLQAMLSEAPATHAGVRLYVEVADLEATLARAAALGATIERRRTYLGSDDFWFGNVRDPQGMPLGLWTSEAPQ